MSRPLVVCCSPYYGEGWRQLGPSITGDDVEWVYFDERPIHPWEKKITRPNVAMVRACWDAVRAASKRRAQLMITQDPRTSFYCALLCRLLRVEVYHYVFSFNFPALPGRLRRTLMRFAFRQVAEFSAHSSMEKRLYSRIFAIPEDRVTLRLWSIGVPPTAPDDPLVEGRYVSSIGGNGRDYRTLIEAARMLPEIPFVLVVRPDNLEGLELPANVKAMVNLPYEHAMNILRYSEFTAVPLLGSTVPAGHVTLVCAMHLGKTVVATDSEGILDYVRSGENGLLCEPLSAGSLAGAIAKLWSDPAEVRRLSENNHRFGEQNCTEARMRADLADVLTRRRIPVLPERIGAEALVSQ